MRLATIRQMITDSTLGDWNDIQGLGSGTAASPLTAWDKSTTSAGWELYLAAHHQVLVHVEDVSLSIAYGMPQDIAEPTAQDLMPDWNGFADDSPLRVTWADIMWNGNPVDRYAMTVVDGARAILPWPVPTFEPASKVAAGTAVAYEVPKFHAHLARLLDESRGGRSEFDRYLAEAGFKVVDEIS